MDTRTALMDMITKKKLFALSALIFFLPSFFCLAETPAKQNETKKEPFKASTLWGIRRGPNAPKEKETEKPKSDERADAINEYYRKRATGELGSPQSSSAKSTSSSSQCQQGSSK